MDEGQPIDWRAFVEAGERCQMMELLAALHRTHWGYTDANGSTLLHCACLAPNETAVRALLASGMVDINARNKWGETAVLFAASCANQSRSLELLCAAGANLHLRNDERETPIDLAITHGKTCTYVLLANGARLKAARAASRAMITPQMRDFEQGVLRCRTAAVALTRVKHAGQLWQWDKFLLREVAIAVWATRCAGGWSEKNAAF